MIKFVIKVGVALIFAVVAIVFVHESTGVRERILAAEIAQSEARTAIDYISYTLRTNDVTGRIAIAPIERISRDAILIRHRTAVEEFDRWIYVEDGNLIERQAEPGEQPSSGEYTIIARVYDFRVTYDHIRSVISIEISYEYNGATRQLTKTIGMRSDLGDGIIIL